MFVDTNILVHAHDVDAGVKHEEAKEPSAEAWRGSPLPWLRVQVIQELLVTLRRRNVGSREARQTAEDCMQWRVVENTLSLFVAGLDEMARWQVSLWDAMILAAARRRGAAVLWSEDMSDGQDHGGVQVVNPLT